MSVARTVVAAAALIVAGSGLIQAQPPVGPEPTPEGVQAWQAEAILGATHWLDFLATWDDSALLPEPPTDLDALLPMLVQDPEYAALMLDRLPPELAYAIGLIRNAQLTGAGLDEIAMLILELLPGMQMTASGLPPFPIDAGEDGSLCPNQDPVQNGGTAVPGSHGSGGDLCILGTGDDRYTTGGSSFGHLGGLAIELGGDDEYVVNGWSFGALGGVFIDLSGDDTYTTAGAGAPGAISYAAAGVFVDGSGNDRYVGGTSSFADLGGVFLEAGGDDAYRLSASGNLGSGALGSRGGTFIDLAGRDTYVLEGGGGGLSGGVFLDLGGDDRYQAQESALGVYGGIALDLWGNDVYSVGANSLASRGGLFMEYGGDDKYTAGQGSVSGSLGTGIPRMGGWFQDLGGSDSYNLHSPPTTVDSTGGAATAVALVGGFIDTEAPNGNQYNGEVRITGLDGVATPGIASPYETFREFAFEASLTTPLVVVPAGEVTELPVALSHRIPVKIVGGDDAGTPMSFQGDVEDIFLTPRDDAAMTTSYAPTGHGTRALRVAFEDVMGLYTFNHIDLGSLFVDGTGPEINWLFDDGTGSPDTTVAHSESDLSVQVFAKDPGSGIREIYVEVDKEPDPSVHQKLFFQAPGENGKAADGQQSIGRGLQGLSDGIHHIHVLAVDGVGNQARAQLPFTIDRTGPTLDVRVSGASRVGEWYNQAPDVMVSAQDANQLSAIAATFSNGTGKERIEGQVDQNGTFSGTLQPTVWPEGIVQIKIEAADQAHAPNAASETVRLHLDTKAPVTGSNIDELVGSVPPAKLSLLAQDATSGVAATFHRVHRQGDPLPDWQEGSTATISQPGHWRIQYRSVDVAGNFEHTTIEDLFLDSRPPVANFTWFPNRPDTTDTILFQDLSTDADGTVQSWEWDFGDGSTSSSAAPVKRFTQPGEFKVTLTVTDDFGKTHERAQRLEVVDAPPAASFSVAPGPSPVTPAQFTDRSKDPDGEVVAWAWSFGDGATSTEQNPSHQYAAPDHYPVTLTVTDDMGNTDSTTDVVIVDGISPTISIEGPKSALTGEAVELQVEADDLDGTIESITWSIAGESTSGPKLARTFQSPGKVHVEVTAIDDDGLVAKATHTIDVLNRPPIVRLTKPESVQTGEVVRFDVETEDPEGGPLHYAWTYGDGASGSETQHAYSHAGTYVVTVTVTDEEGEATQATTEVTVTNRPPEGMVQPSTPTGPGTIPLSVEANDPDGSIATIKWRIGGEEYEGSAIDANLTAGKHPIEIRIVDDDGAETVLLHTVDVPDAATESDRGQALDPGPSSRESPAPPALFAAGAMLLVAIGLRRR